MRRSQRKRLTRGTLAGIVGGLAAAWVMNLFVRKLGEKLTSSLVSGEDKQQQQQKAAQQEETKEDATIDGPGVQGNPRGSVNVSAAG